MARRRAFVNDDVDMSDLWREYRRAQQERRASRLGPRTDEILALAGKGFDVRVLTEYQFRIDGALDLFPIHRRFHDLKTQARGGYQNALDVAIRRLRTRAVTQQGRDRWQTNRTKGQARSRIRRRRAIRATARRSRRRPPSEVVRASGCCDTARMRAQQKAWIPPVRRRRLGP
jgi:hypothetical protein